MCPRRPLLFVTSLLALPAVAQITAVRPEDRTKIRVIGSIANFYDQVGESGLSQKIRRMLEEGKLTVVSDIRHNGAPVFGEANRGLQTIALNGAMLTEVDTRGRELNQSPLLNAALTLFHETHHLDQSRYTYSDDRRRETDAWSHTAEAAARWVDVLAARHEAEGDPEEKKRLLFLLRNAVDVWQEYVTAILNDKILGEGQAEVVDSGDWPGLFGKRGRIPDLLAAAKEYRESLRREVQKHIGQASPAPPAQSTGSLTPEKEPQLLYCACRCSLGCRASASYLPDPKFAGQPCLCQGFGAWRAALTGECVGACVKGLGFEISADEARGWADAKNAQGEAKQELAGTWSGTWENDVGQKGVDSLRLSEDAGGRLTGLWSGSVRVEGRRSGPSKAELAGRTATREYTIVVQAEPGRLTFTYDVKRLDATGGYKGRSNFHKAPTAP